ncbi:CHAD domain-containing protein [Arthrobacter sp. JZ12]|uniref:CYTH and CHAD domain-containing protein n=1 Tax=Arthrobacter sp. JZ12 TaxID=2654190 RepID=UPI002B4658B2|nr:CYTH and CHAD domain-containing protein [Arthrobacter sp. JZ12]WRH24161.1 CHAD domain-containing protein [Arthrobacter sp. JZ12]
MPPKHLVEIEQKFDVDSSTVLPALETLPGVARVTQPVEHQLEAEYFDTGDLRLTSRGITLRRRTGGSDEGWHLKLAPVDGARHEYHEPLKSSDAGVPASLLRLVRVHVRDQALDVVARLRTARTVRTLLADDGGVLAEVSDDVVSAETLLPAQDNLEQSSQNWREWEVELVDGSRDLLEASQALMADAGVVPAAHRSKAAKLLDAHLPKGQKPAKLKAKSPAGEVLLAYLEEQVHALLEQDPRVRLNEEGAIHKMRVATRKMRSALATYRKLLADPETVSFLRGELKLLAGILGEARDAEVMRERLGALVAEQPDELVLGSVARTIDIELVTTYKKAHARVLGALGSTRYLHLVETLEALLKEASLSDLARKPAGAVIPELLDREVKRLHKAAKRAKGNPAGIGDHPALHQARKDAKRLRFAAEAAAPVSKKKASRLVEAAHGVQKVLGDHQDTIVTRELLRRLGAAAATEGENGFTYGRLHALEEATALKAEHRFHREWKNFPSVSLTK